MCRYMVVSRCFGLYDWKKQVINNVTNMWVGVQHLPFFCAYAQGYFKGGAL